MELSLECLSPNVPIQRYGGLDWTKINNLAFIDLVLYYGQKDLDFEKDEPTKKRPP